MPTVRLLMVGVACLLLGLWPAPSRASDADIARQARQTLEDWTTPTGPGAAVLVLRGDKVLYRDARGRADIELGVDLKPDQAFHIASVTKTFTAALVVKLSEQGRLSLDDRLSAYLPDFPGADGITLRQLLTHTAGISDKALLNVPGFSRRDVDMATLVAEIAKRPAAFAPGTSQAYSNAGYILLGAVIEKVTGKPWHVAMDEQIFKPLDLARTRYGGTPALIPGRVTGYGRDKDRTVQDPGFISLTIPASAGALVSTIDDLGTWMRALGGGRVVSKADLAQMVTPAVPPGPAPRHPYGFGLYIWTVRGETMIGHTGQINGFAAIAAYIPSRDITIVALANDDTFDARSFGRRLAGIALGQPYPRVVATPIPAKDLQALAGAYQQGDVVRIFTVEDGTLYSQRKGGNRLAMQMFEGRLYFVPDEISYLVPVRDASGAVVRLDYFENGEGPPSAMPRIPMPAD